MNCKGELRMSSRFSKSTIFMLLVGLLFVSHLYAQGAVFTMTNSRTGNSVLMFNRAANGRLVQVGTFSTGGLGTGTAIANQGGIRISPGGRRLFVVNPGSNDFTVFRITNSGLQFDQRVSSGGQTPVSIATRGNRVFVANAGGSTGSVDNVVGFGFNNDGTLTQIAGANSRLSGASTTPTQIAITPDGSILIVTEQGTNRISVFSINFDGSLNALNSQAFNGLNPSGFAVGTGGRVFVSELGGNAPNGSTISSFGFNSTGSLQQVSNSIPSLQTSGGSLVLMNNGSVGFVGNAGSGTISGFRIGSDGSISLLNPTGISANVGTGTSPADLALSNNNAFLFTLNSGTNTISTFRVDANGTLSPFSTTPTALPAGSFHGLAAQ
ncbi:MAG TPA: beta-propeller fold lactonase family protein [Acidobacteriota bacterium]